MAKTEKDPNVENRSAALAAPSALQSCPRLSVFGRLSSFALWPLVSWAALAATAPAPTRVWPPPPAEPRFAYVQSIAGPQELGARGSGWSKLVNWITGDKTSDQLVRPFGLALDDADNLCLTDPGAAVVAFYDRARKRYTRWEKVGRIHFVSPVAVAKHQQTLFVADSGLQKVIAFDLSGKFLFEIVRGLERPSGLTISGGKLFVADSATHRVQIYDLRGQPLGSIGKRGTGPGEFNFPTHLAASPSGQLLVTDSLNFRIQIFDASGKFTGLIGKSGDSSGHFSRPKGVAVDRVGHVYVIDALFDNVQVFDSSGRFLLDIGGAGSGPGGFWLPAGIAITRDDQIYVADSYNHRLQVLKYLGTP